MEGKRGGTIKKLAQCTLEESGTRTLPSGVEVFCFTIQASSKTLLGVEAERDRLNWIVEILKFRGIGGLIEIVNDPQQKLRRHAAYALCNLAGRSRDDSQTRIVRENGVHCLLEYQKTLEEADLIDSINYSLCKLSSQEDNKVVLAMNMEHLFGLVQSTNERWNEFGLETLRNCSTHPDVKKKILDFGGIEILVGNTLCKKEVMKENSLVLAAECLSNCAENVACKESITANIPLLAVALPAFPPKAQEQTIRLLTQCMIQEDDTVTCLSDIVPTLIPLIVASAETLQEVVLHLFSKLTKTEPHLSALRSPACLSNLLVTISSENVNIVLYSLGILLDCWCNENQVVELARVQSEKLCGFVPLLAHEEHNVVGETIKILDCIVTHDASLEEISRERVFLKSLLPALLEVQSSSKNSHGLAALNCVKKLSRNNFIKLILCEKVLLKQMVSQLTDSPDNGQLALYILIAFRQCASMALAKVYLCELGCLDALHRHLKASEELKQEATELLALLLRASEVRASAGPLVDTLMSLVVPKSSPTVQALACRAIRNLAFDRAKSLPEDTVSALLALVSSKDTAVVENSLSALLNLRFEGHCSLVLSEQHLGSVLKCLEHPQDTVRVTATKLLSAVVPDVASEVRDRVCEDASLLVKIQNNLSKGNLLPLVSVQLLFELLASEGFRSKLAESQVLYQVFSAFQKTKDLPYLAICLSILSTTGPYLSNERKRDILGSECMTRCCRLLHFVSPVILCHATQLLLQCMTFEGNKQLIMKPAQQKLVQLTFYPREDIRQAASQTLLRLKQDDNGNLHIDHIRVLKSLLQSWGGTTSANPKGLSIRMDGNTARMMSERKEILVSEYESPQLLQQHIARAFFVTEATVIPDSPLEQSRDGNSNSKARRTVRSEEGSNFLASMGKRKRSVHSPTQSVPRRDSLSSVMQAHGKKRCKLFASQGRSLIEYRARVDPSFAAQKGSVSHLFELEISSFVGPMEILPPPVDFSLHHRAPDESILKITSDPIQIEHVTVSPTEYPLIEAVQVVQEAQMNTSFQYFEVHVVAAGSNAAIGIGVATEEMALDEQPGWVDNSFGYHGDDGNYYWKTEGGEVKHEAFGPPFQMGDTVGCGWNNVTGELFFTHNGKLILTPEGLQVNILASGKTFRPTVCLTNAGEKVFLNMGQNPFLWNWDRGNTIQVSPAPKAKYDVERPAPADNEYLSGLTLLMNQHKFTFFPTANN